MRRRLKPGERKEELLVAAESLLRERGHGVRVEEIVTAAGAAKGTFYACFESWDAFLEELRAREMAKFEDALKEQSNDDDLRENLLSFSKVILSFIVNHEGLHEALFHSDFSATHPLPTDHRPSHRLAILLHTGQARGVFKPFPPGPMARLLFAAIHEAADAICEGENRTDVLDALNHLISNTVFSPSNE